MMVRAPHPPTDLGNARRFVERHGEDVHYVPGLGWLTWDCLSWAHDETGEVMRRAKEIPDLIQLEAIKLPPGTPLRKTLLRWALQSQARPRLEALIALAQTEPGIMRPAPAFDAAPWLLNISNGTLNLRTGELLPHLRADLLTKLAPVVYDPAATCSRFERFLNRIMDGNMATIRFLQCAIGYALTGLSTEQVLFILHGTGANGKSTLLEILRYVLGDYAVQADSSTFLTRGADAIRNDVARLRGARFITAVEVNGNRRLDEALVKQITGGDTITARFLYSEPFEFPFSAKVFLACNHKPDIHGADLGMWRRIRLIPFEVTIPPAEQNRHLLDALKEEAAGILRWAVEGCLSWQNEGLDAPSDVRDATLAYREQSDALAGFLGERCVVDAHISGEVADLYRAYREWADSAGERLTSRRRFEQMLTERGFKFDRVGRVKVCIGLALQGNAPETSARAVRYADPYSPVGNGHGRLITDADIPEITRRLGGA
jgi:putative DNA primase/helicase